MENIENTTAQTTTAEEVKTDASGVGGVADTNNDAVFTDTKADGQASESKQLEPKDDVKQKSQKTNADFARQRRKQEQEKALKKAKYDAIIDTLNGENPYTHEKMEDEADVDEYLTMKQIEKSGKDPIADYSKFLKTKAKEQAKAQQSESSQKEWIANDKEDFSSKHPDVSLNELLDDELFKTFALGKLGKQSMDKIYTDFQTFQTKSEERARDRAAQILANNASTPGKLSNQSEGQRKSVQDMSKSEFQAMVEKVKRGEIH